MLDAFAGAETAEVTDSQWTVDRWSFTEARVRNGQAGGNDVGRDSRKIPGFAVAREDAVAQRHDGGHVPGQAAMGKADQSTDETGTAPWRALAQAPARAEQIQVVQHLHHG